MMSEFMPRGAAEVKLANVDPIKETAAGAQMFINCALWERKQCVQMFQLSCNTFFMALYDVVPGLQSGAWRVVSHHP